ncbi:lipase family protein [Pseudofrankia sp. BMG5.37]|uniref:lipase family protein n=1 Tax=Pseudofrankia sp. BMG5.37 TaxID=3050035 RepID=UPI002895FB6A|nr:lipase family protein [Pseudofrankia sp. BMG5.37]MDT3440580.1 lipase family protein [Pseudofrankia sp. BMG5.37]
MSYDDIRPYKYDTKNKGFPVYRGLERRLAGLTCDDQPDDVVRHVLAVCSGYAYGEVESTQRDPDELRGINALSAMLVRMGLPRNRCRIITERNDAMLIRSTVFVVQSEKRDVVILVYRGTDPSSLMNWLTDMEIHSREPSLVDLGGHRAYPVHGGFYRNLRSTRSEVLRTLQFAMARRPLEDAGKASPRPARLPARERPALYVTGHSLGGAMAAIMGLMLMTDPAYQDELGTALRAVYTFGQPMIGPAGIDEGYEAVPPQYRAPVLRYIYRQDPVPRVPAADLGPFAHFGAEYRYNGKWTESARPIRPMASILGLGGAFLAFPMEQIPIFNGLLPYTISDHFPQNYIEACANHRSEYGDDRMENISDLSRGHLPTVVPLPSMRHLPLSRAWPLAARLPIPVLGSLRLLRDLTRR